MVDNLAAKASQQFVPFVQIRFEANAVQTVRPSQANIQPWHTVLLEAFVHHPTLDSAYASYVRYLELKDHETAHTNGADLFPPIVDSCEDLLLFGSKAAVCASRSAHMAYELAVAAAFSGATADDAMQAMLAKHEIYDLSDRCVEAPKIAAALCHHYRVGCDAPPLSRAAFERVVMELFCEGVLTSPIGHVKLDQVRRYSSFCTSYGFSRGTPIDRFYLEQFTSTITSNVTGRVLEIGGRKDNRRAYGFEHADEYITVDSDRNSGADIIADVHDKASFQPNTFDSIVIFNVLEHCLAPATIVANIHEWLRFGGQVFCEVPNAQRIHRDPRDYWRILPDALEGLFSKYRSTRITTYGNLYAVIASYCGLAAEELAFSDLIRHTPDYPVISCAIAIK